MPISAVSRGIFVIHRKIPPKNRSGLLCQRSQVIEISDVRQQIPLRDKTAELKSLNRGI
jgi:hypothetical protein